MSDELCKQTTSEHPQLYYWFKVWQLELPFLHFLRTQCHQECLSYMELDILSVELCLDHYHYARWMTVYARYLLAIEGNCPTTHVCAIPQRQVCYTKTIMHKFSAVTHDKVHEQLNTLVRGYRGVIGTGVSLKMNKTETVDDGKARTKLFTEYEGKHSVKQDSERHNKQIRNAHKIVLSEIMNVTNVKEDLRNPFTDTRAYL